MGVTNWLDRCLRSPSLPRSRILSTQGSIALGARGKWRSSQPPSDAISHTNSCERFSPTDDSALQKALAMLVEAEVLYRRGLPTQARYFFKHALIRDAAYESLLKSKRQQIHSRIAHVLQEQFRELAASQPEIVAHHFTEARLLTEAIPFWQKAGQQALQRSAFVESINHLSRALSLLPEWIGGSTLDHQQKQSGEARGGLLLALAQAQARGGQHLKARQTLLQAAEIAQVISSADLAVSVASHLIRLSFEVGIPVTATATRLLSETLERIGPQDSPLRVMTLAGLASALAYAGASDRAIACAQEGAAVARRLGPYIVNDPGGFGHRELLEMVSSAMIQALQAPEHAHQRLIYVNEMLESAKYASEEHDPRGFSLTYAGLFWWRVYSELQLGDVANTKRDIAEYARLADALKQPLELCISRHFQACEASIEGRFEDCERLAHDALAIGQSFETENAAGVFGMQMFTLRREQDRLREIEPLLRHFVQTPEGARAWRPGLAVIYSELRRIEEARSEFEQLAQRDFTDLSRDANWLVSMTYLADVCTFLGDAVRAEKLYKLILPCRAINVLIANGSASYGSVARYLGKLATTMRRWDEAERHFEEALAMNAAMDARPWLAHTQYHYACMLLSRDRAGDSGKAAPLLRDALATARELGMLALEQRIASGSP
jgi:tetratricopeptide (TPR) repeat protein